MGSKPIPGTIRKTHVVMGSKPTLLPSQRFHPQQDRRGRFQTYPGFQTQLGSIRTKVHVGVGAKPTPGFNPNRIPSASQESDLV